jgi:site-specific DNA recombinase
MTQPNFNVLSAHNSLNYNNSLTSQTSAIQTYTPNQQPVMAAPLRYIRYCRRSSDERSGKQVKSIERQEDTLEELEQKLGLDVIERLDESRTAKEPGRPVFNQMLTMIQQGKADAILCYHLDRLTRNEIDSGTIRWLLRQGIIKEIRTPHRVYLPGDSLLITAVESALGEQFIVDHINRVDGGMLLKCRNGGIPFMVPEGYRNDKLTRTAHVDEERFPLIQQLFHQALTESYSVRELHRIFHEEWGYRKKPRKNPKYLKDKSHQLTMGAFYKLLSNPFYAGVFTWKGESYVHHLPRAVTPEQFQQVQAFLEKRSYKHTKRRTFPYTGLMHCATCGYKITAEVKKQHTYYHCVNKTGQCTQKGMREEAIESEMAKVLESIQLPPEFEEFANEIIEQMQAEQQQQHQAAQQAIRVVQQQSQAEIKRQKDALLELYLQGHLEAGEYAEKKKALAAQESALTLQAAGSAPFSDGTTDSSLQTAGHEVYDTLRHAIHFAVQAPTLLHRAEPDTKRYIATHLAREYAFNNGELQIELHPLFGPVRSEFKNRALEMSADRTAKRDCFPLEKDIAGEKFQLWWSLIEKYRNFIASTRLSLPPPPLQTPSLSNTETTG